MARRQQVEIDHRHWFAVHAQTQGRGGGNQFAPLGFIDAPTPLRA